MIDYPQNIRESGLTIYDMINPANTSLYIPIHALEHILSDSLVGYSLAGLPLRTRSKRVKQEVCKALGYSVPKSFKKTQPKFLGQNFDIYTQKSFNVQIWNEMIDYNRRYVFIQINENDVITNVRVISGIQLTKLDRTGTLTQKFQASMRSYENSFYSKYDTTAVEKWVETDAFTNLSSINPNSLPQRNQLLKISELYRRLLPIVGKRINYLDALQERNRGAELHHMICTHLGYSTFEDDGTYPDIMNQLLEIKLQTSPTIDLGLHSPEDGEKIISLESTAFFSNDIRYAIFDGSVQGDFVNLNRLYLVTGESFSQYFPLFQGKKTNKKLQVPLPFNFFD